MRSDYVAYLEEWVIRLWRELKERGYCRFQIFEMFGQLDVIDSAELFEDVKKALHEDAPNKRKENVMTDERKVSAAMLMAASNKAQDRMASAQKAYLAPRAHEYKEGFYSGKAAGLIEAGAQMFSAELAIALQEGTAV